MLGSKLKQSWRGAIGGAVLATGLGLILWDFPNIGGKLVNLSYDVPFWSRPYIHPTDVVLVYMDDDSHRELGQPYFGPWDRTFHAELVERMTADGARAVIFDVLFTGTNMEHLEGDERFARAIKASGKVVLGAEYTRTANDNPTLIRAIDPFVEGAADALGFVEMGLDQDLIARRHVHVPPDKDADSYSSMPWSAAQFLGAPVAQDPANRLVERWINYYGPPNTIPSVSFCRAYQTNAFCPAGYFSNKIVFVGSSLKTVYSGEVKDECRTPYTRGTETEPRVDIHATELLNLLRGDWLTHMSRKREFWLVLLAGILSGAGLALIRPFPACVVAATSAAAITAIAHHMFWHQRIWFSWLIIVAAQIPIALLWSVVLNSVQLYVQNKMYEASLALYLSPKLVKKFASNKELLKPGAKKETLTILFTDIANFTSISEGMDSDDLAKHMNNYFQLAVSKCIFPMDGTIVKYIGDAIFAFWNAPDPQDDHAIRACEAALRFRNQPPQMMNGRPLITRLGLHTGVANVGNFGSTARVDYTALGENINLASRMEGLNKYLGTIVLMTGDCYAGVEGKFVTRYLGLFRLKGFEKSVAVHELVAGLDHAADSAPLREAFAAALKLFCQRKLDEAAAAFTAILKTTPDDGPARFYLKHIAELREHPPESDWDGEIELKEK